MLIFIRGKQRLLAWTRNGKEMHTFPCSAWCLTTSKFHTLYSKYHFYKLRHYFYILKLGTTNFSFFTLLFSVIPSSIDKISTSRTKVVTITVQTLPSILTLWRRTCSSNWCMHSTGWTESPLEEPQKLKDFSTSCDIIYASEKKSQAHMNAYINYVTCKKENLELEVNFISTHLWHGDISR